MTTRGTTTTTTRGRGGQLDASDRFCEQRGTRHATHRPVVSCTVRPRVPGMTHQYPEYGQRRTLALSAHRKPGPLSVGALLKNVLSFQLWAWPGVERATRVSCVPYTMEWMEWMEWMECMECMEWMEWRGASRDGLARRPCQPWHQDQRDQRGQRCHQGHQGHQEKDYLDTPGPAWLGVYR